MVDGRWLIETPELGFEFGLCCQESVARSVCSELGAMATDQASLNAVVARLEAAVARLESLGSQAISSAPKQGISSLVAGPPPPAGSASSPSVAAFDELVQSRVGKLLAAADKIGGNVLQASQVLQRAFEAEKAVILAISQCKVSSGNKCT